MDDINNIVLSGRLTRDPELKVTPSGMSVCNFSLAVNRKWKGEEEVSFIDCTAFGKTGEIVAEYKKKGEAVVVIGLIKQERWEKDGQKRSKIGLIANQVTFLPGSKRAEAGEVGESGAAEVPADDDDNVEIPF